MKTLAIASFLFAVLSGTAVGAFGETAAAVAHLKPAQNSQVAGTIQFFEAPGGVRIVADVSGLSPGKHGFHIHEKSDLSALDLSSAGGHFNPTKEMHGDVQAEHHHLGDFGNLNADDTGHAKADFVDSKLSLDGANTIIGHSIIIHGGVDDLKSQPAGNSGPRVAGGVIEKLSSP